MCSILSVWPRTLQWLTPSASVSVLCHKGPRVFFTSIFPITTFSKKELISDYTCCLAALKSCRITTAHSCENHTGGRAARPSRHWTPNCSKRESRCLPLLLHCHIAGWMTVNMLCCILCVQSIYFYGFTVYSYTYTSQKNICPIYSKPTGLKKHSHKENILIWEALMPKVSRFND